MNVEQKKKKILLTEGTFIFFNRKYNCKALKNDTYFDMSTIYAS